MVRRVRGSETAWKQPLENVSTLCLQGMDRGWSASEKHLADWRARAGICDINMSRSKILWILSSRTS